MRLQNLILPSQLNVLQDRQVCNICAQMNRRKVVLTKLVSWGKYLKILRRYPAIVFSCGDSILSLEPFHGNNCLKKPCSFVIIQNFYVTVLRFLFTNCKIRLLTQNSFMYVKSTLPINFICTSCKIISSNMPNPICINHSFSIAELT